MIDALRAALAPVTRFNVRFEVLGGFPNERSARLVWVGAREPDPAFGRLVANVREVARSFAHLDEKAAVFHVTIARLREPERLPTIAIPPRIMSVAVVALFESLPADGTTRYEIVERFTLPGRQ